MRLGIGRGISPPTFRQGLTGFSLLYGVLNWIHLDNEHHRHVSAIFSPRHPA